MLNRGDAEQTVEAGMAMNSKMGTPSAMVAYIYADNDVRRKAANRILRTHTQSVLFNQDWHFISGYPASPAGSFTGPSSVGHRQVRLVASGVRPQLVV